MLLSWSAGKDSAWALHVLRRQQIAVTALVTTINRDAQRVSMQGVRLELLRRQARAAGLDLWEVELPSPCPNEVYERKMENVISRARTEGISHVAYGDLYLEDVRAYREEMMAGTGVDPLFPIWVGDRHTTRILAQEMIESGVEATITCVDPTQLDPSFAGRRWDKSVDDLPDTVDPLGENGELHTFCHRSPAFTAPIPVETGRVIERDGFWWADLLPAPAR